MINKTREFLWSVRYRLMIISIIVFLVGVAYGLDYIMTRLTGYDYVPWRWGTVVYDASNGTLWARENYGKRQIFGPDGKPLIYEGWVGE